DEEKAAGERQHEVDQPGLPQADGQCVTDRDDAGTVAEADAGGAAQILPSGLEPAPWLVVGDPSHRYRLRTHWKVASQFPAHRGILTHRATIWQPQTRPALTCINVSDGQSRMMPACARKGTIHCKERP